MFTLQVRKNQSQQIKYKKRVRVRIVHVLVHVVCAQISNFLLTLKETKFNVLNSVVYFVNESEISCHAHERISRAHEIISRTHDNNFSKNIPPFSPCPRGNAGESFSTYGGIVFLRYGDRWDVSLVFFALFLAYISKKYIAHGRQG